MEGTGADADCAFEAASEANASSNRLLPSFAEAGSGRAPAFETVSASGCDAHAANGMAPIATAPMPTAVVSIIFLRVIMNRASARIVFVYRLQV